MSDEGEVDGRPDRLPSVEIVLGVAKSLHLFSPVVGENVP